MLLRDGEKHHIRPVEAVVEYDDIVVFVFDARRLSARDDLAEHAIVHTNTVAAPVPGRSCASIAHLTLPPRRMPPYTRGMADARPFRGLRYDPTLATLHDDPRFAALVKKMGFLE